MDRVGVLALQGDVREHAAVLARLGVEPVEVRTPEQLRSVDGLIIPGGESTTIGKLADRFGLTESLRRRIEEGMPTYGTCAGMIFLAAGVTQGSQPQLGVLDAVVERNAFGRQNESFEADLEVVGWQHPFHAVFIRAPWVAKVGSGVEVLAEVEGHPVMVRQGNILATSFHPELTDDDRVHRLFLDLV
jgi:5'-phosphate synthase pdxT subunit